MLATYYLLSTETETECDSSKNFLLLDEVAPQHRGLPPANQKDCMVKIQDLICYWDKVRLTLLDKRGARIKSVAVPVV